jgi:hypothetical protein
MSDNKREFRQLKREIKKAGNRKMRRQLQRELRDNPTEAQWTEFDYGMFSSKSLNGIDRKNEW